MGFFARFSEDEKRTVRAELSNLLHHYDDVDPVIRVGNWNQKHDGFRVGMTAPTPSDEDITTVRRHLKGNGYETKLENNILYVVGETEEMDT